MAATIILNSSNMVEGTQNSLYRYQFPKAIKMENMELSVSNLSMYYSWYNITQAYGNNQIRYKWFGANGVLNQDFTVDFADGYYSVQTMNEKILSTMNSRGHYLEISNTNDIVYYFQLTTNETYYSVQLDVFPVPTAAQIAASGLALPSSATWAPPATATTPQLQVLSNGFRDIIGFDAGLYPAAADGVVHNFLSSYTPQVSPVSSIVLTTNLINNELSSPSNVLYSFSIGDTAFGGIIREAPFPLYLPIMDATYSGIEIRFNDQLFNRLRILDKELIISLSIKQADPKPGKQ